VRRMKPALAEGLPERAFRFEGSELYFVQAPGLNPGCGLACCPGAQLGGP